MTTVSLTGENAPYIISFKNLRNQIPDKKSVEEPLLEFSPLSGSEPNYEPKRWNLDEEIKDTHNCYAYVLNKIVRGRKGKPQPGYFSGYPYIEEKDYKCSSFYNRLKRDIPSLYLTTFNKPCAKGFYKGFIAMDPKREDQDYHFYRQDKTGYWSHKPGRTDVIDYDANKKKIKNPLLANRKYKYFNYSVPCFYFCVKSGLGRIESETLNSKRIQMSKREGGNFINKDLKNDALFNERNIRVNEDNLFDWNQNKNLDSNLNSNNITRNFFNNQITKKLKGGSTKRKINKLSNKDNKEINSCRSSNCRK
jgi:hypothetical protein